MQNDNDSTHTRLLSRLPARIRTRETCGYAEEKTRGSQAEKHRAFHRGILRTNTTAKSEASQAIPSLCSAMEKEARIHQGGARRASKVLQGVEKTHGMEAFKKETEFGCGTRQDAYKNRSNLCCESSGALARELSSKEAPAGISSQARIILAKVKEKSLRAPDSQSSPSASLGALRNQKGRYHFRAFRMQPSRTSQASGKSIPRRNDVEKLRDRRVEHGSHKTLRDFRLIRSRAAAPMLSLHEFTAALGERKFIEETQIRLKGVKLEGEAALV